MIKFTEIYLNLGKYRIWIVTADWLSMIAFDEYECDNDRYSKFRDNAYSGTPFWVIF